jgi:hypothetical protein
LLGTNYCKHQTGLLDRWIFYFFIIRDTSALVNAVLLFLSLNVQYVYFIIKFFLKCSEEMSFTFFKVLFRILQYFMQKGSLLFLLSIHRFYSPLKDTFISSEIILSLDRSLMFIFKTCLKIFIRRELKE